MSEVLAYTLAAGGLGVLAFVLLLVAIKKRSMKALYACLIAVLLAVLAGARAGYGALTGAYAKWEETDIKNPLRGRTGAEAYAALFGASAASCVEVIHLSDPVLPRIDCCIWLEFRTCPQELGRIIAQQPFKQVDRLNGLDTTDLPPFSPRPEWFDLKKLGSGYKILRRQEGEEDPNSEHILYISADSTHALYCDMEE